MARRSLSVLQNVTASDVRTHPFPLVVVDKALPQDLYDELTRSFPSMWKMGIFDGKNNHRWNYPHHKAKSNPLIPSIWREFLAYHSSDDFLKDVISVFGKSIVETYPDMFPSDANLKECRGGARTVDSFTDRDVLLEAMISGNTPVKEESSVRTSHVDAGDKLFSGLLYMRPDKYKAIGGDLTISKFKEEYSGDDVRKYFAGQFIDDSYLDVVSVEKYAANKLVLFINSPLAVHGVTPRAPTTETRRFINLVGEVPKTLYVLPGRKEKADS
jgi:hypothetical protein